LRTQQQLPEDAENVAKRQRRERAIRVRKNQKEYEEERKESKRILQSLTNTLGRIKGQNAGMASEIERASTEIE
jgi:hypothetical protein